jgi:CBS domain containing-hemolysin-like protein
MLHGQAHQLQAQLAQLCVHQPQRRDRTYCLRAAAIGILFLGEFLPKLFFSASPLRRIIRVAPAWRIFERVFSPAAVVVLAAVNWLLPKREASVKVTPDTVLKILQDRKDGVRLSEIECALISRIMVLRAKGAKVTPESLLEAI